MIDWYRHHKNKVMYTKEWQDDAWALLRWYRRHKSIVSIQLALIAMVLMLYWRIVS